MNKVAGFCVVQKKLFYHHLLAIVQINTLNHWLAGEFPTIHVEPSIGCYSLCFCSYGNNGIYLSLVCGCEGGDV